MIGGRLGHPYYKTSIRARFSDDEFLEDSSSSTMCHSESFCVKRNTLDLKRKKSIFYTNPRKNYDREFL